MNNRNLLRGIFLMAVALIFGVAGSRYPIQTLSHAGPGLFPVMVSCFLFILGLISAVRAFLVERVKIETHLRSIAIVLLSLCGFAFISTYVGMVAGTIFMVFFASLGATTYSWKRCAIIAIALVIVALVLDRGLGLSMPLFDGPVWQYFSSAGGSA